MKALVLIHQKLNFVPVVHMLGGCDKYNIKRVNLANHSKKYIKTTSLAGKVNDKKW